MTRGGIAGLLALSCLLSAVACGEAAFSGETYFVKPPEGQAAAAPDGWTHSLPREILEDPLDVLRLVNREHTLEKGYPPDGDPYDMVPVGVRKASSAERLVRPIAQQALLAMAEAAGAQGLSLVVESGYRSYGGQAATYERYLARNDGKDGGYVQPAGASEHQTGLALDIINPAWISEPYLNRRFAETEEAKWMAENGPRFGFIIRYPEDKEDITGIRYEPWHLRYVGPEVAEYMQQSGLCLEEFHEERQRALSQAGTGE